MKTEKQMLHRRVYDEQARAQVLREMQGKSFDVLLICNRCIVGAGTYAYTDSGVLIREEYGACIGFLDRPFLTDLEGTFKKGTWRVQDAL